MTLEILWSNPEDNNSELLSKSHLKRAFALNSYHTFFGVSECAFKLEIKRLPESGPSSFLINIEFNRLKPKDLKPVSNYICISAH